MKRMNMNRLSKTLVGITLSFSLLAPVDLIMNAPAAHAATISSATAANILATGQRFMGVRYKFGAPSGRTDMFDCSSFVQYIFKQNGINLPRSSRQQSKVGTFVPRDQLQPGDLIFFYTPIHHVAVYMGNGKILHTYGSPGVTISDLNGKWGSRYNTARRVLPSGQTYTPNNPVTYHPNPVLSKPSSGNPYRSSLGNSHRSSSGQGENNQGEQN